VRDKMVLENTFFTDLICPLPSEIELRLIVIYKRKKNLSTHNIAIIPLTKYLGEGNFSLGK
jgi:hypothetical protein